MVTFAGRVAATNAVTVDHGSGVETTYTGLSSVHVAPGDAVTEGRYLGTTGTVHGTAGLHFGVKVDGVYADPTTLLHDIDVATAIHLAPLTWTPDGLGDLGDMLAQPKTAGTARRSCREAVAVEDAPTPPNDNVAVAVAGITSKTADGVSADIYEHGPEVLGYPERRVYRFSYAGINGERLHQPYERSDTYGDIRIAAQRLRRMLVAIAARHPDRDVDLIAHSQGGIVARAYLALVADGDRRVPAVDHLVTFATPHRGAPAAGELKEFRDGTRTGRYVLRGARTLSQRGMPVPDPSSVAVAQLAPGSDLMSSLVHEDVAFGTRVLALGVANDPVVPADHALYVGEQGRVIPWTGLGLGGHSAIVTSPVARGLAYRFLADHAPSCPTGWDELGLAVGGLISTVESTMAEHYGWLERAVIPGVIGRS